MSRPFVLLDRDGTIIKDKHYLSDPAGVELLPGATKGLSLMREAGLGLAVLSNQSGVGRGLFNLEDVRLVNQAMKQLLAREGVELDGVFFCPHAPEEHCSCRKPLPGLVEQAVRSLDVDPTRSFVIGDKACDVELGRAVGAKAILVRTGKGAQCEADGKCAPDMICNDLHEAGRRILQFLSQPVG